MLENRTIESGHYPLALLNLTNRCNLACSHCFVFRDGNPNDPAGDIDDETLLEKLKRVKEIHGIVNMLWMGGEPLIRKKFLKRGLKLFNRNIITTNGTIPLEEFDAHCIYVVSLDGPEDLNDPIRGRGVFQRVMKNISRVPERFAHTVQCQMAVTKKNSHRLEEFVKIVAHSRFDHMTFSFYVPQQNDTTGQKWDSLEERDSVIKNVMQLKKKYPGFIKNKNKSLELMLSPNAKAVTDDCPSKRYVLPLYVEEGEFVHPFCCYGNDVDCDQCGAWNVFDLAAREALRKRFNRTGAN